jgi:3-hydroxyacyl-CoA dehydrogenase/enoyl-CoA hydratase/3-hydroxybutyryl-CoA epimerase
MTTKQHIDLVEEDGIAILEWDHPDSKVNKMTVDSLLRLEEILEQLNTSDHKAAVIISRKGSNFMAGVDLALIKDLKTKKEAYDGARNGQEIFNRIEDLKIPVVVAIHGPCVGGGCEMSMACDYRIATDDTVTRIGLPETKIGVIPGFGGSVRMPRMLGLQVALDLILGGKLVSGEKALKVGLVDKVVPKELLREQAIVVAKELSKTGKRSKRFKAKGANIILESPQLRWLVKQQARKSIIKKVGHHYPALFKAIEVAAKTLAIKDRQKALHVEAEGFAEVAVTDVSKNLIKLFFLADGVKKQNGVGGQEVSTREIKNVGVLGAGTMGTPIAYTFANRDLSVRICDLENEVIGKSMGEIYGYWEKALNRGRLDHYAYNKKKEHVSGGTDFSGFGQADLVLEAIVEDKEVKTALIKKLAPELKDDCIFATNTASLSIDQLAKAYPRPENFVGFHFFYPAHKMPLVEIVRGEKTSDQTVATVFELAKKLRKTPVVVSDSPGFLVNRLLFPYLNEAVFFLEEGMSMSVVDKHYKDFGLPMGPFQLMDEIGLDIVLPLAKALSTRFGERMKYSQLLEKMVSEGRLGRKSGKGFYTFNESGKAMFADSTVYSLLNLKKPTDPLSKKEVLKRGLYSMINEAALVVNEERIVKKPEDVDTALIFGVGFPPFHGGLLRYADKVGSESIADDLEEFAMREGERLKPSTPLRNMAKTDRAFYC